ncbi:MAG: sigma-70 family RNA polymerase sigma factor [Methylococcaceae bacterium]
MAYLTEYLSKQELTVVNNNAVKTNEKDTSVKSSVSESPDSAEHCNFQVAAHLKDEKNKLINVLCQFPVTALWLFNEHEESCYRDDLDDEINNTSDSELATTLNTIKKNYLSASQLMSCKGLNDADYLQAKQDLVTALLQFPFSFDELTKLVDVIVYAYKFRGLCYQPANLKVNNKSDLIINRLEGFSRGNSLKASKLSELFKSVDFNEVDEQFLFLSSSEMHRYFTEIVLAEHRWLNLRQELASANSRLVLFIANQYKAGFLDFEDLVQEGQTGLLKAVDRFDHRLGFQFSTYAGYWIRQAISRSLSRCERVVRVPCGQVANINKVYRAKDQFISQTGRDPSIKDLAEYTNLSSDEVNSILSISQTALSIEGSGDDEESSFAPIDYLEQQVFTHPYQSIAKSDLERLLSQAIAMLNPREARVICCHFGVDCDNEMTLQEIGSELNLTRERVRQIQVMALNKIKQNFGQQLMSFL